LPPQGPGRVVIVSRLQRSSYASSIAPAHTSPLQPTPCPSSRSLSRCVSTVRAGMQTQTTEAVGGGSLGQAPLTDTPIADAPVDVVADACVTRRYLPAGRPS